MRVLLTVSKIKVVVDHAGPSQPPQLLRVLIGKQALELYFLYQSNNLLTVIRLAMAVMEVSNPELWNI